MNSHTKAGIQSSLIWLVKEDGMKPTKKNTQKKDVKYTKKGCEIACG